MRLQERIDVLEKTDINKMHLIICPNYGVHFNFIPAVFYDRRIMSCGKYKIFISSTFLTDRLLL